MKFQIVERLLQAAVAMPVAKCAVVEVARDDDQLAVARSILVGGEFS